MHVDWKAIVFSPDWMEQLDRIAIRRFSDTALSEEASSYVIEKITDNDWKRLQSFSGGSKPETFLYSVTSNLLEEFSRERFGRRRPPEWLKREGGVWLKTWKMLCLERQPSAHIIDLLCSREKRSPEFVGGLIKVIKARIPSCGEKPKTISLDQSGQNDDRDYHETLSPEQPSIEQSLDKAELEDRLLLLSELLETLGSPSNTEMGILDQIDLTELRKNLALEEEEILVVRMAYKEGFKLKLIATALNMPSYQPGRILKGVFKKMEAALQASNVDPQTIRELLVEVEL